MYRPAQHLVFTVATAIAVVACFSGCATRAGDGSSEGANQDAVSATVRPVFGVVVHAQRRFDRSASAKLGIDRLVAAFQAKERPVAFLTTDPGDSGRYTAERKPNVALTSAGGERHAPTCAKRSSVTRSSIVMAWTASHRCTSRIRFPMAKSHWIAIPFRCRSMGYLSALPPDVGSGV